MGDVLEWDPTGKRAEFLVLQPASVYYDSENSRAWVVPSFFKFRQIMLPYIQKLELSIGEDSEEGINEEE